MATASAPSVPVRTRADLTRLALMGAGGLMDVVSAALHALPGATRYAPADALSTLLPRLAPGWRRMAERNYAALLRTRPDDPRVRALAQRSLRNYGRMTIDFLESRNLSDEEVLARTRGVGEEHLREALDGKRGVIFALPHLGSWDMAAAFAVAYGCPLTIVTEGGLAADLVMGSRLRRGNQIVPRTRSLRPLFRTLARNQAVVMLSDIAQPDLQLVSVPFFGREAPFPAGPARLSQHTGAPVMVASCVRLPNGTFVAEGQVPLQARTDLDTDDAVRDLTARIVQGFGRIIRAYPDQWYPYSQIWPE